MADEYVVRDGSGADRWACWDLTNGWEWTDDLDQAEVFPSRQGARNAQDEYEGKTLVRQRKMEQRRVKRGTPAVVEYVVAATYPHPLDPEAEDRLDDLAGNDVVQSWDRSDPGVRRLLYAYTDPTKARAAAGRMAAAPWVLDVSLDGRRVGGGGLSHA